jgi:hypothetical protein
MPRWSQATPEIITTNIPLLQVNLIQERQNVPGQKAVPFIELVPARQCPDHFPVRRDLRKVGLR